MAGSGPPLLRINMMPHSHRRAEYKVGVALALLLLFSVLALFWIWRSSRTQSTLVQECYDEGGSEVVETSTGQIMCLRGNTIVWRK